MKVNKVIVNEKEFLEIREDSYEVLQKLKNEYEKIGKKTWLNFDCDWQSDFVLTVAI